MSDQKKYRYPKESCPHASCLGIRRGDAPEVDWRCDDCGSVWLSPTSVGEIIDSSPADTSGLRHTALEFAIKAAEHGECASITVGRAKDFLDFLSGNTKPAPEGQKSTHHADGFSGSGSGL